MSELAYEIAGRLSRSGSTSPGPESRILVCHVLGLTPGQLMLVDEVPTEARDILDALVSRRIAGEPLQYLTGQAHFRHETLRVGPGVFIPRPETEEMVGWALQRLAERPAERRRVVELCAGSGAISAALTGELGGLDVHAVELSVDAFRYLELNLADREVELLLGDMSDAFPELDGSVDLVIANPPYVPEQHRNLLPSDVVDHDPHLALFAGPDGLAALRVVARVARRLLAHGGLVAAEHDESHAKVVREVFAAAGFEDVHTHPDLTTRPRFVTARQHLGLVRD